MADATTKLVLHACQKAIEAEGRFKTVRRGLLAIENIEDPGVIIRKAGVENTRRNLSVHVKLTVDVVVIRKNNAASVITTGDELEDDIAAIEHAFETGLGAQLLDAVPNRKLVVHVTPVGHVENVIEELAEYADAVVRYELEYDRPFGG